MSKKRTPSPMPGAEPKRVTIKARWWDSDGDLLVDLISHKFGRDDWEVYLPDGTWIGTVGRYTGSLDRKISGTRLVSSGKRRTLWSERRTGEDQRTIFEYVSRADAIRRLIEAHKRGIRHG